MKTAKVIKHSISFEFICPVKNVTVFQKIENPRIYEGKYYEDWSYTAIEFKCKNCGEIHKFEIEI